MTILISKQVFLHKCIVYVNLNIMCSYMIVVEVFLLYFLKDMENILAMKRKVIENSDVELVFSATKEGDDKKKRRSVHIKGLPHQISETMLKVYCSNKKRGVTGPIEKLEMLGPDSAIVVYKNSKGMLRRSKKKKNWFKILYILCANSTQLLKNCIWKCPTTVRPLDNHLHNLCNQDSDWNSLYKLDL